MKYEELSEDAQLGMLKERLKQIEASAYQLQIELAEARAMREVAGNVQEVTATTREVDELEAKTRFHNARLKVLRQMISGFGATEEAAGM